MENHVIISLHNVNLKHSNLEKGGGKRQQDKYCLDETNSQVSVILKTIPLRVGRSPESSSLFNFSLGIQPVQSDAERKLECQRIDCGK